MEKKLIEFVSKNEFLYNKRHKNHRNLHLRNSAFEELSKKINVPARRLKHRWRILRDRFRKEVTGCGSKKRWKFLDDLMFLKNVNIPKPDTLDDLPMFNHEYTGSESLERQSPPIETSTQTSFSDDILEIMEDIMGDVNNGISQVVKMAKDVLAAQTERKTAAQLFFESIAAQVDEAKLSATEFTHLQMEMLSTFNKFLIDRVDIKVEF